MADRGHFAERWLGVLYGQPGAGKSFLALDWANHLSAGHQWFSRNVKSGNVIYVCAEGATGLKPRVRAWRTTHSGELKQLRFITRAVNMLDRAKLRSSSALSGRLRPTPA